MRYSLICMDIDGTLLTDTQDIAAEVKAALARAVERGTRLALVSMRYPSGINMIERQLGLDCIKAAYAGAYIYDDKGAIYSKRLDYDTTAQICETAYSAGANCWFYTDKEWSAAKTDSWVETESTIVRRRPAFRNTAELERRWREGLTPNKMLIAADNSVLKQVFNTLTLKAVPVEKGWSSDHYLEIMPRGIDKGTALERICEIYSIPIIETIAFGDQDTDIPLIKKAGIGVAMGNGIAELKACADLVTRSNNEAGIAYALKQILK